MIHSIRSIFIQVTPTVVAAVALALSPLPACAQAPDAGDERVNEAMKRAAKFYLEKQDPKTGAFHEKLRNEVTMTALSLLALAGMGHQPSDPTPEGEAMKRGMEFVLKPEHQQEDGYFGKS